MKADKPIPRMHKYTASRNVSPGVEPENLQAVSVLSQILVLEIFFLAEGRTVMQDCSMNVPQFGYSKNLDNIWVAKV
jgi:hypothetical protein